MVTGRRERMDPPLRLGRYCLQAKLGEGGMATVYLASVGEGSFSRPCAIKCLRNGIADRDYRQRFLDEAAVVVRLHHNNLVDVREAGDIEGQLFLVMELVEGRDLADIWDRCAEQGRAVPVPLGVHIVREVLRGLHYAHTFPELGLVHRDVSPSNILIDWAGAVRLADFGLATSTLKVTRTRPGIVFGKVTYMSPEQAFGRPLDARSDVYSCGIVLWELLTGRPFRGAHTSTERAAEGYVEPPSRVSRRVDAELDDIVLRALARAPEDRFPSASGFMEALGRWIAANAPETTQERLADFLAEGFPGEQAREHAFVVGLQRTERPRPVGLGTTLVGRPKEASPVVTRARGVPPTERLGTDATGRGVTSVRASVEATRPEPAPPGLFRHATVPQFREGTDLLRMYRLKGTVGEGRLGKVYAATHLVTLDDVALRVLPPKWSLEGAVASRIREVLERVASTGYPAFPGFHGVGRLPDQRLILSLELLRGHTLSDEMTARRKINVARACVLMRDVARALRVVHACGVVFEDLKPQHVFLQHSEGREVVRLLDVGLSVPEPLLVPASGRRRARFGLLKYAAPEQIIGASPSPSFDVFAFGAVFHDLLCVHLGPGGPARVPFSRSARPPLRQLRPDLPEELQTLVDECLSVKAVARVPSMDAVLVRLEWILDDLGREPLAVRDSAPIPLITPGIRPVDPSRDALEVLGLLEA